MPIISGGGGGGGDPSAPLLLTLPEGSAGDVALRVEYAGDPTDSAQLLSVGSESDPVMEIGSDGLGDYILDDDNGATFDFFRKSDDLRLFRLAGNGCAFRTPGGAFNVGGEEPLVEASDGEGGFLLRLDASSNKLSTGIHAAPADGALAAGECALWFDQTNGAAKLMVKAKQANGTVVAASVALA